MNVSYSILETIGIRLIFKHAFPGERLEGKSGVRRTNSGLKWFSGAWLRRLREREVVELTGTTLAQIFIPIFVILQALAWGKAAVRMPLVPLLTP